MAEVTRPTVYKWIKRYARYGIEGLTHRVATGRSPEISTQVRATILALSRQSPPERTGLSYWSSREMARYLQREMGVSVSHNFVAALWREHDIQPPRLETVNPSTDPDLKRKRELLEPEKRSPERDGRRSSRLPRSAGAT